MRHHAQPLSLFSKKNNKKKSLHVNPSPTSGVTLTVRLNMVAEAVIFTSISWYMSPRQHPGRVLKYFWGTLKRFDLTSSICLRNEKDEKDGLSKPADSPDLEETSCFRLIHELRNSLQVYRRGVGNNFA